jgi:hypothetical protein
MNRKKEYPIRFEALRIDFARNSLKNLEQLDHSPIFAAHSNRMYRIA